MIADLLRAHPESMMEWRCPRCNGLLMKLSPGVGMHLEIACKKCGAMVLWTTTAPEELVRLLDRIDRALQD